MTNSNTDESGVSQETREWIEEHLSRLDFVEWDRFVEGFDPAFDQRYIEVYGWIEREKDDYKDFVLTTFYPDTDDWLCGYTTSSDRYTDEIYRRMFDREPDDHNDCQRVESTFYIENAITLRDRGHRDRFFQTELDENSRERDTENEP